MNAQTPIAPARLDARIIELLCHQGPLSPHEIAHHLQHKREKSVNTALDILRLRGHVQRVGLNNRFRLSPTQAARCEPHPEL